MEKELEVETTIEPERQSKEIAKLEGDEALLLWLEGKDAWNKWAEKNPRADVSFAGVEFSYTAIRKRFPTHDRVATAFGVKDKNPSISFEGFIFPNYVIFSGATFDCEARFTNAKFNHVAFFVGSVFKLAANFGAAIFSKYANFQESSFESSVNFYAARFLESVKFSWATFKGKSDFSSTLVVGRVHLDSCEFGARVDFSPLASKKIYYLNLRGAHFEKELVISGVFSCIPDLRQTKTNHHVDLSGLKVRLRRDFKKHWGLELASNINDAERLCRLKEIAESNKNHERALKFHADELRARRWIHFSFSQSIIDSLFSLISNYGQSIGRPICCLTLLITMYAQLTLSEAKPSEYQFSFDSALAPLGWESSRWDNYCQDISAALIISVATVTPFLSISKKSLNDGLNKLFKNPSSLSGWYVFCGYLHSFFSFIFIFLIGLGLRNRFRI